MRSTAPSKPPRPGLPLLLPCALGLWAVAAATYSMSRMADRGVLVAGVASGIVLASAGALVLAILFHRRVRTGALLGLVMVIGCALGCGCGCAGALGMQADAAYVVAAEGPWLCELASDAKEGSFSTTAQATVHNEEGRRVTVRLDFDDESAPCGESLTVGTRIRADLSMASASEKNADYLWGQGVCATAKVRAFEVLSAEGVRGAIAEVRDRAIGLISEHGGSQADVLAALVCGYRIPLEESGAYDDYKTVGLAHVVAVSGAHLAIVTATLGAGLRLLRAPRKVSLLVMASFASAYVVFAGVPVSAVRAVFMVLLMLMGQALHRRSASLNALALCVIAFIALDPSTAVSVSFFLSCGSTLGIVLFAALFSWWFSSLPEKLRKPVGDPLALTFSSNVATLPFSTALFSQMPLIAPVANVLATPLFSLGCVFGLVAVLLSCLMPFAAAPLIGCAGLALWPLAAVTSTLASVPFACIPAAVPVVPMIALSVIASAALWFLWPSLSVRVLGGCAAAAVACGSACLFLLPLLGGPSIVMLDVGQGDAFLIRDGPHALLIDTGDQDAKLRESLGRNGVYALDAVLITHGDADHCGSLAQLGAVTRLGRVLLARDALVCDCAACEDLRDEAKALVGEENVIGLSVGDSIRVGAFGLRVLWPERFADEGGNADSLCVLASLDADHDGAVDWRAFFCGDAESEQLEQLVERGALGKVDVLKVGHHGSRVALTSDLARTLDPAIALIGVGANNRYGHPTEEVLAWLREAGAETFRSDLHGDVALSFTAERISVECEVQ